MFLPGSRKGAFRAGIVERIGARKFRRGKTSMKSTFVDSSHVWQAPHLGDEVRK
jgi:hypothetical protein